jgi:hypothetical protein
MHRNVRGVVKSMLNLKLVRVNRIETNILRISTSCRNFTGSKKNDSSLFKPIPIKVNQDDINIGAEITGMSLDKGEVLKILNKFSQKAEIRMLCVENGMDRKKIEIHEI